MGNRIFQAKVQGAGHSWKIRHSHLIYISNLNDLISMKMENGLAVKLQDFSCLHAIWKIDRQDGAIGDVYGYFLVSVRATTCPIGLL